MRPTTGRPGHTQSPTDLFGAAPARDPGRERQHDPSERPDPLADLCGRADRLLEAVRTLAGESRRGPGLRIERIDVVSEQLGALQAVFAEVAGLELRAAQVSELGGARRDITDALVLTLEMLERAR